jgi:hypothetical protein
VIDLSRAMISDADIVVVIRGSANDPAAGYQTNDLRKSVEPFDFEACLRVSAFQFTRGSA